MAFFKTMFNKLLGEEADADEVDERADIQETDEETEEMATEEAVNETAVPQQTTAASGAGKSIELKISRLTSFDASVTDIADQLISGCTVVLNLEEATKDATRRIIDFFTGVAYSIRGSLKCFSAGIYIVTPSGVDVASDISVPPAARSERPAVRKADGASPYEGF